MDITCHTLGDEAVLDLRGGLFVSSTDAEVVPLREVIGDLIARGRVNVALNLAGLSHVDARGLGEFVRTLMTLRSHGGNLTILDPSPSVRRILAITRLDTMFTVRHPHERPTTIST